MADFTGEKLTLLEKSEATKASMISVDDSKILQETDNMSASQSRIEAMEAEFETAASDYTVFYEGESSVKFYNAFMVLQGRQENLQTQLGLICTTLRGNALGNRKINDTANISAGCIFGEGKDE